MFECTTRFTRTLNVGAVSRLDNSALSLDTGACGFAGSAGVCTDGLAAGAAGGGAGVWARAEALTPVSTHSDKAHFQCRANRNCGR